MLFTQCPPPHNFFPISMCTVTQALSTWGDTNTNFAYVAQFTLHTYSLTAHNPGRYLLEDGGREVCWNKGKREQLYVSSTATD